MNRLSRETSPYLLQHSHNPVDWYPWGEEAWNRAKEENKPVIISIGYSACHWCHVMERESFEDEQVARLMNKDYICIKVDREERPDVDQFYMDAANIMTGKGGWPLNAFALPDGRPVYAGTYFPKTSWTGLLHEIASGYRFKKQKYFEFADKIMKGMQGLSPVNITEPLKEFPTDIAERAFVSIANISDRTHGGKGRAPKFPMPDIYTFLLSYHFLTGNFDAKQQSILTLDKMAQGGIYDQIGGGFARYSTDAEWKVPHFEKMLYDNAQLIGLYSEAFSLTGKPLYKTIVYQTLGWIKREMLSPDGGFYSSIDADSEGEEGKFYVWKDDEIETILGDDAILAGDYYGVGKTGYWENGNNILVVTQEIENLADKYHSTSDDIRTRLDIIEKKLFDAREVRVHPGLDNKILMSWNALTIKGLIKAYNAFKDSGFLELAERNYGFVRTHLIQEGRLYHTVKNGVPTIPGFLEDYAYYIEALIELYQANFNEAYLHEAIQLIEICLNEFYDAESGYFFFTSSSNNELASWKIDIMDNVISSPNSVMAYNLFILGKLFDSEDYIIRSKRMLSGVLENMQEYGAFHSNWARLALAFSYPFTEIAICGEEALSRRAEIAYKYKPGKILLGTVDGGSEIPLLLGKYQEGKTLIYSCVNKTCGMPAESAQEFFRMTGK